MNDITLKGLVISKYGNVGNFAKALGWSRNKTMRIVNGIQEPHPCEIVEMTEVLDISTQELFMQIFFNPLSTKWTTKEA